MKNNLETNPDEKTCLSSKIEAPQVEKVVKFADFPLNPLCKSHREIMENPGFLVLLVRLANLFVRLEAPEPFDISFLSSPYTVPGLSQTASKKL